MKPDRSRRLCLRMCIFLLSAAIAVMVLRSVQAGTLAPLAAPAGTNYTLGEIFNPLASTAYDSSGIAGNSRKSAIQMARCIVTKLHGGSC